MKYKEPFETPTFKGHPLMERYELARPFFDSETMNVAYRVQAMLADMRDEAIVSAIVEEAQRQGLNDLILINKEFIVSAIIHEIQRLKGEQP